MIEACIFDLDGVLVDTARYHFLSWIKLAKKLNFTIEDALEEKLKGISRMDSLEIVLHAGKLSASNEEKIHYAALKNEWYLESIKAMKHHETLPGVVPMLDTLKANNIKIAVGSASKNAISILNKIDLLEYFEVVIDGNHVEKTKPDPEVFLKAAAAINCSPEKSIVFEDSAKGIQAAHAGNFNVVGIGQKENLQDAELVIEGFMSIDILQLIRKFNN